MTAVVTSDIPVRSVPVPVRPFSSSLKNILGITGMTGLWEAEDIDTANGLRLKPKLGAVELTPYRNLDPVVVTGSHGKPAVQMGYGGPGFDQTERGALCVGEGVSLFGTPGFTLVMAMRAASAAESGGGVGGYLAAARNEQGANPELMATPDSSDPRLVIQSASGFPRVYGGDASVQAPVDVINSPNWFVVAAYFDDATDTLGIRLNGGTTAATVTATGSMPAHDGSKSAIFGIFNAANALPFYGQISAIATANRSLSIADLRIIEQRFGILYGIAVTA